MKTPLRTVSRSLIKTLDAMAKTGNPEQSSALRIMVLAALAFRDSTKRRDRSVFLTRMAHIRKESSMHAVECLRGDHGEPLKNLFGEIVIRPSDLVSRMMPLHEPDKMPLRKSPKTTKHLQKKTQKRPRD